jgi:hypothetical protein
MSDSCVRHRARRAGKWALASIVVSALGSSVWLVMMSRDERSIALPGLLCVNLTLLLWMVLYRRDGVIPLIDVGMLCALATCVYSVYPLINYWAAGMKFTVNSDTRLYSYGISAEELGSFHWRNVLYLGCFVCAYMIARGRTRMSMHVAPLSRSVREVSVTTYCLLLAYFVALKETTGVAFLYSGYGQEAFRQSAQLLSSMPLIVRQVSGKLYVILFLFKLLVLFLVVRKCSFIRWKVVLFAWLAVEAIMTVAAKGPRTDFMLFVVAACLFYDRLVRRVRWLTLVGGGVALLTCFIALGLYRGYGTGTEMMDAVAGTEGGVAGQQNEFQTLLGTAYDVMQRKAAGGRIPSYLHFNDVITILPPQQLLPFEKIPAAEWYLSEVGLSGSGEGLMWGVITQSIVGGDWAELVMRGILLAIILACVHRWYAKHSAGALETVLYVFVCVKIYYTYRDTTLSMLSDIVIVVAVALVLKEVERWGWLGERRRKTGGG